MAPGPCSLPSCAVHCVTCGPLHRAGPTGLLHRGPGPSWAVLCTAWYAVPSTEQVLQAFSARARGLPSWAAPSWGLGALQAACPLLLALRPVKLMARGSLSPRAGRGGSPSDLGAGGQDEKPYHPLSLSPKSRPPQQGPLAGHGGPGGLCCSSPSTTPGSGPGHSRRDRGRNTVHRVRPAPPGETGSLQSAEGEEEDLPGT